MREAMDHDHRGTAPALPGFGAKPWVINFKAPMEEATETLLNPFDGSSRHVDLPMLEGTTCLRCFGAWSLMLHDETKDCFLLDLASLSTIPLPPLLEPLPAWPHRPGCALSSSPATATLPDDCTVVVVVEDDAEFLLYCRPGDEQWSKFFLEHDTFLRPMHGSRGKIYATSGVDWELLVIDVDSAAGVHVVPGAGAIDQIFRLEPPKSLGVSTVEPMAAGALASKFSRSLSLDDENTNNEVAVPWSTLHIDYIELLVPKLSSIDYLHLRAVCQYWSKIIRPIQDANPCPMLLHICSNSGDKYRLFDPMTSKEYDLNQGEGLFHGEKLLVLFSKCGWVLITEGTDSVTALNPFTKEAFQLPPTEVSTFQGISFSSAPASPDSVVLMVEKWRNYGHVNIFVWHAGDEDWTFLDFNLEPDTKFELTYNNPVFLENKFYCLGRHGNLAVFSLLDMEWKVLNKPECIYQDDDLRCEIDHAHLLELRGELIAVFVPHHKAPIQMFKLDKGQMAWTKLERLDDATMFVDNWGVILIPQPNANLCNRIYLPKYGLDEDGDEKISAYYDLVTQQYCPEFYNLMEPMNSIWIQPNFTTTQGDKIITRASSRLPREVQTEDFEAMSDYGFDYNEDDKYDSENVEEKKDDEDEDEEEHLEDESKR